MKKYFALLSPVFHVLCLFRVSPPFPGVVHYLHHSLYMGVDNIICWGGDLLAGYYLCHN